MEVSNKKYNMMAKDYKKADKVYKEIKGHAYGYGKMCDESAMNPNYDYKKGIKEGIMSQDFSSKKAK